MKTVLIAHNYSEDSFSAMSYYLANHLAAQGFEVVFISHQPYFVKKEVVKKKGIINIYSWVTKNRPTSVKDFIWFTRLYFKYKPNIVIGHFVGSNISILMSKLLSLGKVRTFEYYHTLINQLLTDGKKTPIKQKLLFIRKKMFYWFFCDKIVCPSELAKKDFEAFYKIKKGMVLVNPLKDRFNDKLPLRKDTIVISYLGRLDKSKGILETIKAFKLYIKKKPDSKLIFNIAGSGHQEKEIEKISKKENNIIFLGRLSYNQIDNYLNKSHYAIIPSKYDNLPTVGLEAMMNKTPLLISNSTGLTDYLVDGKECYKFDTTNEGLFALFQRVESNFKQQDQMAKNARLTFENLFSMENYCEKFTKLILCDSLS